MKTIKVVQKWGPVALALLPLVVNFAQNALQSIESSPPPAGVVPALWTLIQAGQKAMAKNSSLVSVTLGGFLWALTNLAWRSEEILKVVREIPRSNVTWLAGAAHVFDHLTQSIRDAETRIFLMYLRPNPAYDEISKEYWDRTTKLFIGKKTGHLPIRRIASFDERVKLDYLLENNSRLFTEGGSAIRQIEYELRAFPYKHVKPLRVDIIDDTAFMFKTYESQIMVKDKEIVKGCLDYYEGLWKDLDVWTVIDTCRAEKLKPAPGRTEYGYSEAQIVVIARLIRDVLKEKPSQKTFALIEPHCEMSWEAFEKLCTEPGTAASPPNG